MSFAYKFVSNEKESGRVAEALAYATKKHAGQYRKNGYDEYIVHPTNVASHARHFLEAWPSDGVCTEEELEMAAYLHDTLEDTDASYEEIKVKFGICIADLVLELTSDKKKAKDMGKTQYLSLKMLGMSNGALIIKLCDRLDNVSDLMERDEEFRVKYAKETYSILLSLIMKRKLLTIHLEIIKSIIHELVRARTLDIGLVKKELSMGNGKESFGEICINGLPSVA